jgi:hypothetical protein
LFVGHSAVQGAICLNLSKKVYGVDKETINNIVSADAVEEE